MWFRDILKLQTLAMMESKYKKIIQQNISQCKINLYMSSRIFLRYWVPRVPE